MSWSVCNILAFAHAFHSSSSVPVSFAYSVSSMVPFLSFFNNRYSRANSSSSSAVCVARLCRAVFFLKMGAATLGVFLGSGFASCFCASFLAWRFFFRCFSRDLSLISHVCKLVSNFYFAISFEVYTKRKERINKYFKVGSLIHVNFLFWKGQDW